MNDFDASKKKQKLTVHELMKKAEQTKGGKGGLRSVVGVNSKTERHGPNKGETVVRMSGPASFAGCFHEVNMLNGVFCLFPER